MSQPRELVSQHHGGLQGLLPPRCSITVSCYEHSEIRHLVASVLQGILESFARTGMDLRALDGVTFTPDCAATSVMLQALPEGQHRLETGGRPDMMEMARTVPTWRNNELRFHIIIRAGLGVGLLCDDASIRALGLACVAHEAAHVEHESHLYRMFPHIYGKQIPCGDRSSKLFIKAMDVWSEYAACRSAAMFRPEAAREFEKVFCRAMEDCLAVCRHRTATCQHRSDAGGWCETEQLVGDVFVCAGYFLGHLDGLRLDFREHAPHASELCSQNPEVGNLLSRLHRMLDDLWASESVWPSVEVFSPVYDVLCAMMIHQGLVLEKADMTWRMSAQKRSVL